ncbi:MAG: ABC transporter permease [Bacteroidota bacterium]
MKKIIRRFVAWRKSKSQNVRVPVYILSFIVLTSLLAPWLASPLPYTAQSVEGRVFPLFNSSHQEIPYDTSTAIYPPFPGIDRFKVDSTLGPLKKDAQTGAFHILGTTTKRVGKVDLLSAILYGGRQSLMVAFFTLLIISLLGFMIGGISGYWGDHSIKFSLPRLVILLMSLPLIYFYSFYIWRYDLQALAEQGLAAFLGGFFLCLVSAFILLFLSFRLSKIFMKNGKGERYFPVDSVLLWLMQLIRALPSLLLIITLTLILKERSLGLVMLLVGLTGWSGMGLLVRGEVLRERNMPYIQAVEALGIPPFQILFYHLIPNVVGPIIGELLLGFSSIIILEATLSFLGVIDSQISWGILISTATPREMYWWQALFPGLWLFATVICLQLIGEHLRQKWTRSEVVE